MAKKVKPNDVFGQFFAMTVSSGADASAWEKNEIPTGLSIRGGYIWLIHAIEFMPVLLAVTIDRLTFAVSTRKGLMAVPNLPDDGLLAICDIHANDATPGFQQMVFPHEKRFMPPLPFASPNLTFGVIGKTDEISMRGINHEARVYFTTLAVEEGVYTEIAEVWSA